MFQEIMIFMQDDVLLIFADVQAEIEWPLTWMLQKGLSGWSTQSLISFPVLSISDSMIIMSIYLQIKTKSQCRKVVINKTMFLPLFFLY